MLVSALPHSLLLLLLLVAAPTSATNAKKKTLLRRASGFAAHHTTNLARDLRVAFGSVLPRSAVPGVIYCKSNAGALAGGDSSNSTSSGAGSGGGGTGGSANSTASVSGATTTKKGSSTGTATGASATATSAWHLTQNYEGSSFFDGFTFWDTGDPTHGTVQYLSRDDGEAANLVSTDSSTGNAIMRVETTPTVSSARKSIRITTNKSFTGGLVIMDAVHMPTGCGTWPAFWSNGPNWPTGGEIDVVEGVNDYTNNQATIHTAPGCSLPTDDPGKLGAAAAAVTGGTDCAAATSGNAGCGMRSKSSNSFGAGFNANGGGVYAMQWDSTGISVFFFARGSVPGDIDAGAPQPKNWGLPMAHWPASDCDPWKYFYTHVAIFDTTLCGDWSGWISMDGKRNAGAGAELCDADGFSTCEAFVLASGSSFAQAYWEVKSLKFYNTTAAL